MTDKTSAEEEKSSDSSKDDSGDSSETIPVNVTAESLKAQAHVVDEHGDATIVNGTANGDSKLEEEAAR
jgi:hypothetical protein